MDAGVRVAATRATVRLVQQEPEACSLANVWCNAFAFIGHFGIGPVTAHPPLSQTCKEWRQGVDPGSSTAGAERHRHQQLARDESMRTSAYAYRDRMCIQRYEVVRGCCIILLAWFSQVSGRQRKMLCWRWGWTPFKALSTDGLRGGQLALWQYVHRADHQ